MVRKKLLTINIILHLNAYAFNKSEENVIKID